MKMNRTVENMKATFIGKYYGKGFDRNMVYLEYEYRGRTYTVYENRAKGNEPLSWQHRNAQADIDRSIELESTQQDKQPIDWDKLLDEIFEMNEWT